LTFFGGMKLPASSLLGAVAWTAITVPGLSAPGKAMFAVITSLGITAAAYRTVSPLPLDYSIASVSTCTPRIISCWPVRAGCSGRVCRGRWSGQRRLLRC
jgi:hypothetical protein